MVRYMSGVTHIFEDHHPALPHHVALLQRPHGPQLVHRLDVCCMDVVSVRVMARIKVMSMIARVMVVRVSVIVVHTYPCSLQLAP